MTSRYISRKSESKQLKLDITTAVNVKGTRLNYLNQPSAIITPITYNLYSGI
jgi:CheY-specific phosphatase CheX